MFCKNCGNQISDNATFCTKCGTRVIKNNTLSNSGNVKGNGDNTGSVDRSELLAKAKRAQIQKTIREIDDQKAQREQRNEEIKNVVNKVVQSEPVKSVRKIISTIITIIVLGFLLLVLLLKGGAHKPILNNNLGANTPEELGKAYATALKYNDISYIDKYWDAVVEYGSIKSEIEEYIKKEDSYRTMMDINSIEIIEQDEGSEINRMITVKTGHVGDEYYLPIHNADTPQGTKWFIGNIVEK